MADNKYALWLIPMDRESRRLQAIIDDLSKRHGTPRFVPHLTVCSSGKLDLATANKNLARLAQLHQPLEISLTAIGKQNEYYRCLFIDATASPDLLALRQQAADLLGVPANNYMPHVSLMYGNIDTGTKQQIITMLDQQYPNQFLADSLYLYDVSGEPSDWRRLARFPLTGGN